MKKLFILGLLVIFSLASVSAIDTGYCVEAAVNDITPSSVEIGEEFTVGIVVENCGELISEQVIFGLKELGGGISVKEDLERDIGRLNYANSERFIVYHMKVASDARPGEYVIRYELRYGPTGASFSETGEFSVTVTGDEAELSIASVKTDPVLPYEGNKIELTLRIENYGTGTANSVRVYADHPFNGIKEKHVGSLDTEEDGPATLEFIAGKPGEFIFPINIFYKDDFGEHEVEENISIIILDKKTNWIQIISIIVLVAVIAAVIIYYFRTKKEKNRLIQELLNGNSDHKEEIKKKRR